MPIGQKILVRVCFTSTNTCFEKEVDTVKLTGTTLSYQGKLFVYQGIFTKLGTNIPYAKYTETTPPVALEDL